MLKQYKEYQQRLNESNIYTLDIFTLQQKIKKTIDAQSGSDKFDAAGNLKKFYGLTNIAWITEGSALYNELVSLHEKIQADLSRQNLADLFYFLKPESFHMTLCDVVPINTRHKSESIIEPAVLEKRLDQVNQAFQNIPAGQYPIVGRIDSLQLANVIKLGVAFNPAELQKTLTIEKIIKRETQTDVRQFTGHISLAYFTKAPGLEKVRSLIHNLKQYDLNSLSPLLIRDFDFTYFYNMENYIPLLSKVL